MGPERGSIELLGFDRTFLGVRQNLLEGSIEPFWGGRRFQGTVLKFPLMRGWGIGVGVKGVAGSDAIVAQLYQRTPKGPPN